MARGIIAAMTLSDPKRGQSLSQRLAAIDWAAVEASIEAEGHARLPGLLGADDCAGLAALYDQDRRFRSTVVMARHNFGSGEYRYFARPLPRLVADLRRGLYKRLAPLAARWRAPLGLDHEIPAELEAFLKICAEAGQSKPTPLLLRYGPEDYNCLHQDLYGAVAFPLQVAICLSRPGPVSEGGDFEGGEFLLVEQRPRAQSRGEAIALQQGEALIFPNQARPVQGKRGTYRVKVRHGVSRLRAGARVTLGIIFHDAA